jgi:ribosomal protein L18E
VQKSILRQIQDEIRDREWSMADLADTIARVSDWDPDRTLVWRKVARKLESTESERTRLDVEEIEAVVRALRTRSPGFTITYPNNRRRTAA